MSTVYSVYSLDYADADRFEFISMHTSRKDAVHEAELVDYSVIIKEVPFSLTCSLCNEETVSLYAQPNWLDTPPDQLTVCLDCHEELLPPTVEEVAAIDASLSDVELPFRWM